MSPATRYQKIKRATKQVLVGMQSAISLYDMGRPKKEAQPYIEVYNSYMENNTNKHLRGSAAEYFNIANRKFRRAMNNSNKTSREAASQAIRIALDQL